MERLQYRETLANGQTYLILYFVPEKIVQIAGPLSGLSSNASVMLDFSASAKDLEEAEIKALEWLNRK